VRFSRERLDVPQEVSTAVWSDNETDVDLLGFDYLVDGLVVALIEAASSNA
jgi:hypothetical protein